MPLMSGQYQMRVQNDPRQTMGYLMGGLNTLQEAQQRAGEQRAQTILMDTLAKGGTLQEAAAAISAPVEQPTGFLGRLGAGFNPNTPAAGPTQTGGMLAKAMMDEAFSGPARREQLQSMERRTGATVAGANARSRANREAVDARTKATREAQATRDRIKNLLDFRMKLIQEIGEAQRSSRQDPASLQTMLQNVEREINDLTNGAYGTTAPRASATAQERISAAGGPKPQTGQASYPLEYEPSPGYVGPPSATQPAVAAKPAGPLPPVPWGMVPQIMAEANGDPEEAARIAILRGYDPTR